jgi:ATP-binding cassette, subfamily B, bacterial
MRTRRVPELRQLNATECGAACLAMILGYYGRNTSVAEIRNRTNVGRDGLSALAIVKAARDYGLRVRAISVHHNDLHLLPLPAILHWEFSHFVVLERWSPSGVQIVDPAIGRRRISAEEFDQSFTGVVILLEPGVQFARQPASKGLSLWSYMRYTFYAPGFVIQILAASLLVQGLGLALPLFTQVFVDRIIPLHMSNVMLLIGVGMLLVVLTQLVTTLLRSVVLVHLQARVDTQMMLGFFEHLLTLPYAFFQQRSSGDLLTRLSSNITIRDTLTNQMISTFLDGGTVLVYLLILLTRSWLFALATCVIGLLQVGCLLASTRIIHELTLQDLVAQGKAQGYMTEALAGIATLKSSGTEQHVLQRWSNLFFEHLNVSVRRDSFSSIFGALMTGLSTLAPLLLLWLGTTLVLRGALSIGTMLALNSLAAAFLTPFSSLASSGQKLQLVQAHLERIADVMEAEPEQDPQAVRRPPALRGKIELRKVNFRYDAHGPLVLRDINLCIYPGQKVALVGRTGSGKSTLGKLLLGLYLPTEGEIFYDDLPLRGLNLRELRNQFGVILQESFLFSGSVRENIAFNNPSMGIEQVVQAAQAAAIHDEIARMPMGYETLVAEGATAISGGQRQRLSIARALASRPAILLLDEATSHLDVTTEKIVDRNLSALACTRIVIAHRLSTVRDADLILVLHEGRIVEQGTHEVLLQKNGYYTKLVQSQLAPEKRVVTKQPQKALHPVHLRRPTGVYPVVQPDLHVLPRLKLPAKRSPSDSSWKTSFHDGERRAV